MEAKSAECVSRPHVIVEFLIQTFPRNRRTWQTREFFDDNKSATIS